MPVVSKNLMIGLPESGKTTFIAALNYVVETNELDNALRLTKLNDDTQYLSSIVDYWADCEPMPRTNSGFTSTIVMQLKETNGDRIIELSIPDTSGETFQHQWVHRQWDDSYARTVREATGIFLLIHAGKVNEPKTIRDAVIALNRLQPQEPVENDEEESVEDNEDEYVPWDPSKSSTGVQLVDLLQFILDARFDMPILRLGIIVSAWDLVERTTLQSQHVTPKQWLQKRIPLLYQFLRANQEDFQWKVFGVSAQGGDFSMPSELQRLQSELRPAHRIIVHNGEERIHDITDPIRWIADFSNQL